MASFLLTLSLYLLNQKTDEWIIKNCISSLTGAFIVTIYLLTMVKDEVREKTKNWLNFKIAFPIIMIIIQPLLWANKLKEIIKYHQRIKP